MNREDQAWYDAQLEQEARKDDVTWPEEDTRYVVIGNCEIDEPSGLRMSPYCLCFKSLKAASRAGITVNMILCRRDAETLEDFRERFSLITTLMVDFPALEPDLFE